MTNELTLSLPKNVFQELFDLIVFRHENREAVLLNWLKCLCRIDSTLEKDRVDSIIYKNNSRNCITESVLKSGYSLKYSLIIAADPLRVIEFCVAVLDMLVLKFWTS